MPDTGVTKVDSAYSPRGAEGQRYLASGRATSMRLWDAEHSYRIRKAFTAVEATTPPAEIHDHDTPPQG